MCGGGCRLLREPVATLAAVREAWAASLHGETFPARRRLPDHDRFESKAKAPRVRAPFRDSSLAAPLPENDDDGTRTVSRRYRPLSSTADDRTA